MRSIVPKLVFGLTDPALHTLYVIHHRNNNEESHIQSHLHIFFITEGFSQSYYLDCKVALQVFCVCVVSYEVYRATLKYLSNPVANVVYTIETELPMVTVCNAVPDVLMGPLPMKQNYLRWKGEFYHDDKG